MINSIDAVEIPGFMMVSCVFLHAFCQSSSHHLIVSPEKLHPSGLMIKNQDKKLWKLLVPIQPLLVILLSFFLSASFRMIFSQRK